MANKRALVAYIPALHMGYLNLFSRYSDATLYILGDAMLSRVPRMDRDIRAVSAETMKKLIESLDIFTKVKVVDTENIKEIVKHQEIVMPDEDVSHDFATKYFGTSVVTYSKTFLRWDKLISSTETIVPEDRAVSANEFDRKFMKIAESEMQKSPDWWRHVGAVIVIGHKPVLIGHNRPYPEEHYTVDIFGDPRSNFDAGKNIELSRAIHAESSLIAEAARRGQSLEGADIYVTTFPCPVCAKLVAAAGIKKVYYSQGYSLLDAEDILRACDIEIILVKEQSV